MDELGINVDRGTGDFECPRQTADTPLTKMLEIERADVLTEAQFSMEASRMVNILNADFDGYIVKVPAFMMSAEAFLEQGPTLART